MKNAYWIVVLLFATFFAAIDARAVTVRGRVERQTSYGQVAAGAVKVTLNSTASGRSSPAYTDPQGYYYIYNVPAGTYTLEVWSGPTPVTLPISVGAVPTFSAPPLTIR
jgi:Carboxypeptidase regulatory-like domain